MLLRRVFCAFALLLAATAALCPSRPAAAAPQQGARGGDQGAAYQSAHTVFVKLLKDEKKAKHRVYWLELEERFAGIYKSAPEGPYAGKALYFSARSFDELGRRSQLRTDQLRAVEEYERVAARFPRHNLADDALLRKARLHAELLNEPQKAQAEAQRLLDAYPKSESAAQAKELLKTLAGGDVPTESKEPNAGDPAQVRQARAASPRPHEAEAKPEATGKAPSQAKGLNRLLELRRLNSEDKTRVALVFENAPAYRYELLGPHPETNKPQRLYIDVSEAALAETAPKETRIETGPLGLIRLAQNSPRVVRAVLEFKEMGKYELFTLENPPRLVIDVFSTKNAPPQTPKTPDKPAKPDKSSKPSRAPEKPAASTEEKAQLAMLEAIMAADPAPELDPLDEKATVLASNERQPSTGKTQKEPDSQAKAKPPAKEQGKEKSSDKSDKPAAKSKEKTPDKKSDKTPDKPKAKAASYRPSPEARKRSNSLVEQLGLTVRTIMIDPGHGGKDPGATGVKGLEEKDVNLKVGLALGRHLHAKGFRVLYTRKTDAFIPLEDRTAKANAQKADLFISIHCNSFGDSAMQGMETYYLDLANSNDAVRVASRENAVSDRAISDLQVILTDLMLNSKLKESRDLAKNLHGRAVKTTKAKHQLRDHGVHSAPFYVLMGAKMPAVLLELGYITNPDEAKRLNSASYIDSLAEGLAQGVSAYKSALERLASR
jgi:N-acetylmuramoyl-L-alanine amidase